MFRKLSPSATQPLNLRRRHQARHENGFQHSSHHETFTSEFGPLGGNLDLSMHHASSPFTVVRDRELHASGPRRRPRNSRGTKEAKKRRDARRNKRKLAAQLLDEQLSREIDETLRQANIHPPPPISIPAPTPVLPMTSFSQPWHNTCFTRWSPPPPQLPQFSFNRFDLSDFPQLAPPRRTPTPPPSLLPAGVPSWCPHIPSWMRSGVWSGDVPTFYDLSRLPERTRSPAKPERCQELQLWQGSTDLVPRKQSRFFPSSPSPRPMVKLPPTGCKLHRSDSVIQDPLTAEISSKPTSIAEAFERLIDAARNAVDSTEDSPSPVNLWHILNGAKTHDEHVHSEGRQSSWGTDSDETGGIAIAPIFDQPPVELDSREVPYVHANSLTGYANDNATYHSTGETGNESLIDSAIYLAGAFSTIDDELPTYELAAMPWPMTPRSPTPPSIEDRIPSPPVYEPAMYADTNTDGDDFIGSVAHYESEQRLFEAKIPLPPSPIASECDLATFLSMGHVDKCWCRDCDEEPELVGDNTWTPSTEQDSWVMWSTTDGETVSDTTAQVITMNDADDEAEEEIVRRDSFSTPDWNDFYPCKDNDTEDPEPIEEFLGYLDDGPAFARESEYDWMWNV